MFWEDKSKKKTDWLEEAYNEREKKKEMDNKYNYLKEKTKNMAREKEMERMERKVRQDEFNRSAGGKAYNMSTGVLSDLYVSKPKGKKGKKRSEFGSGGLFY